MPELRINPDKVCYVILKAREFQAKVPPEELEDASDPADDDERVVLEDRPGDATEQELRSVLHDFNEEELEDFTALMWLGRGDYAIEEWPQILQDVRAARGEHHLSYFIETPLLGDYLEEGLDAFGISCADFEEDQFTIIEGGRFAPPGTDG